MGIIHSSVFIAGSYSKARAISAGGARFSRAIAAKSLDVGFMKFRPCSSLVHAIKAEAWKNAPVAILLNLIIHATSLGAHAHSFVAC
jgi:hypothetical protein